MSTVPALQAPTLTRGAARWTAGCAAVYVVAWLVGLAIAPASPASDAAAAVVHAYYAGHPAAVLTQSFLVHGLAGLALLGLAIVLPAAIGCRRVGVTGCGAAAAAVSLAQFALAATLTGLRWQRPSAPCSAC